MTLRSQRFPAAILLVALLAACGGGGGGGGGGPSDAPPVLVGAACVTNTGTPVAGDQLILTYSEPVELVAGRLLDDADFQLGGGATLGAVVAAPVQFVANVVFLELGPGAQITPGVTTIAMRTPAGGGGNDVVRDASGQFARAGAEVTIAVSDGAPPVVQELTIAAIQSQLNGTGPAGGTLQTPSNGFTITLSYADNVGVATDRIRISANRSVTTPAGSARADSDLVPFLTLVDADTDEATLLVPSTVRFPDAPIVLTAIVLDDSGRGSAPRTFDLTVRAFDDARRPFETRRNPTQSWFLDFSRDVESFTATIAGVGADVAVVPGANGRSDVDDILLVLGLLAPNPVPNAVGNLDSNEAVRQRFVQQMIARLDEFYAGTKVRFTTTAPAASFGASASVDYNSFGHSRIAIAGAADTAGVLGVAIFDPNNATQNDDTRLDFGGRRLGVFLHTIVDFGMGTPSATTFRTTFDAFTPVFGGAPIGAAANDAGRLAGTVTDARRTQIDVAIRDFARFCATVVAHECGHSMGLVQDGPMPTGLYGGDAANFPLSTDGHIRNADLFPSGAINVMSPALSYDNAIATDTAFNRLNLAYLREQVTYGN